MGCTETSMLIALGVTMGRARQSEGQVLRKSGLHPGEPCTFTLVQYNIKEDLRIPERTHACWGRVTPLKKERQVLLKG